jgi:hypothetical protein
VRGIGVTRLPGCRGVVDIESISAGRYRYGEGHPVGVALVVWLVFGGVLLSHILSGAVPSALVGLASGFGMGPGVSRTAMAAVTL